MQICNRFVLILNTVPYNRSLAPVHTQHALTTQLIDLDGPNTASSKTYFTASHFGQGVYEGELLTAWGRYDDALVKTSNGWRVKTRTLVYMVTLSLSPYSCSYIKVEL